MYVYITLLLLLEYNINNFSRTGTSYIFQTEIEKIKIER